MAIELAETSIQGMAIDIIETCHTEVTAIEGKKKTDGDKKTNPLDKSESISRCATCQSIYHWANDQMSK